MEIIPDYVEDIVSIGNQNAKQANLAKAVKQVKQVKDMSTFEKLYILWAAEDEWKFKKSRFEDLMVFKRRQKKSWKTLGANDQQQKELKKFEERIK